MLNLYVENKISTIIYFITKYNNSSCIEQSKIFVYIYFKGLRLIDFIL